MPGTPQQARALELPREEHWTLHHVLLHRIEQEETAPDPADVDPPAVEVFQAFDTLDAGRTDFTTPELKAMQAVLAEYHHSSTWWEIERARIEHLLHRITDCLERDHAALPAN